MSLPSVKPKTSSVSTAPGPLLLLPGSAGVASTPASVAATINPVAQTRARLGRAFPNGKARTGQRCKSMRPCVCRIQTDARGHHGRRRTVQINDKGFGGRSSRKGVASVSAFARGASISTKAKPIGAAFNLKGSTPAK